MSQASALNCAEQASAAGLKSAPIATWWYVALFCVSYAVFMMWQWSEKPFVLQSLSRRLSASTVLPAPDIAVGRTFQRDRQDESLPRSSAVSDMDNAAALPSAVIEQSNTLELTPETQAELDHHIAQATSAAEVTQRMAGISYLRNAAHTDAGLQALSAVVISDSDVRSRLFAMQALSYWLNDADRKAAILSLLQRVRSDGDSRIARRAQLLYEQTIAVHDDSVE